VKNDGIVIKYENMQYSNAVQHASLILDLCSKSKKYIRELLEGPVDNEVESLRLRAYEHDTGCQSEMMIAQTNQYTILVIQKSGEVKSDEEAGEGKEKRDENK